MIKKDFQGTETEKKGFPGLLVYRICKITTLGIQISAEQAFPQIVQSPNLTQRFFST